MSACLRAASPAWQYTDNEDHRAALAGVAFKPSAKRAAFEELAASPVGVARFGAAFRVALSMTGYRPVTVAVCNALNGRADGSKASPVVLCQPSDAAFGKRLTAQLQQSCAGAALTSHTGELAYLLPQDVREVTAGNVVRTTSVVEVALQDSDSDGAPAPPQLG